MSKTVIIDEPVFDPVQIEFRGVTYSLQDLSEEDFRRMDTLDSPSAKLSVLLGVGPEEFSTVPLRQMRRLLTAAVEAYRDMLEGVGVNPTPAEAEA